MDQSAEQSAVEQTALPQRFSTKLSTTVSGKETRRFLKFALVGASGTVIDVVLLSVLVKGFHVSDQIANTVSYSVGVINNFLLNRFWTFPEARQKSVLTQFGQFAAINVVGLLLSDLILSLAENVLNGWLGSNALFPAKIIAIGLVFFWNLFANRLWTYNDVDKTMPNPADPVESDP